MNHDQVAHRLVLVIAALACALAVRYGTFVPWGTDAAGYVEASHRWARAQVLKPSPLALGPSWGRDGRLSVPLAFRPGLERGTDVSIYPLGYPVLMAAALRLGGDLGPYLVVPVCFAVLVWATHGIGAGIAGAWAGLIAATLMAVSPVAYVSALQPMSDVPATAFWVLAWAMSLRTGLGASAAAGAATGIAIMVRPNLAPLGLVVAWLQCVGPGSAPSRAEGWRRLLTFGGLAALGPGVVLWSQSAFYGHPLAPSYAGWEAFYRTAHVPPNFRNYPRFLVMVHTPLAFAGLAAPLLLRIRAVGGTANQRVVAWSAVALAILTFVLYLPFIPYDDVQFLRFMMPAVTALFALLAGAVVIVANRLGRVSRWLMPAALVLPAYVAAAPLDLLKYGRGLRDGQQRVVLMGRYLDEALPPNAVVVSFLQSGALAHYTQRPVMRYDLIPATMLDDIVAELELMGLRPVLVLDEVTDVSDFRERFATSPLGALDWAPRARARDTLSSLVYFDFSDRTDGRASAWPTDVVTFP